MTIIHIILLATFEYAKTHMVRSYELYSNYVPIFIPTMGGVIIVLLGIMLIMLRQLNKKVDRLEEKVTILITE